MEYYLDYLPKELKILLLSEFIIDGENSMILLYQSNLFTDIFSDNYFWKTLFNRSDYYIFNKDLLNITEGDSFAIKKSKKYDNYQMFIRWMSEYENIRSSYYSYNLLINEIYDSTFLIPFDWLPDISLLIDYIDYNQFILNVASDTEMKLIEYYIDIKNIAPYDPETKVSDISNSGIVAKRINNKFIFEVEDIILQVKDPEKFFKIIMLHIFYHRYPISAF